MNRTGWQLPLATTTAFIVALIAFPGCDYAHRVSFASECSDLSMTVHALRAVVPEGSAADEPRVFEKDAYWTELERENPGVISTEMIWVGAVVPSGRHVRFVSFDVGQTWVPVVLSHRDLAEAKPRGSNRLAANMFLKPPGGERAGR